MKNDIVPVTSIQDGVLSALVNAEELLRGASLLLERNFVSTYDLIILALEEIGKAVLLWKHSDNFRKETKIKRDPRAPDGWFYDHKRKLEAVFWFHRKGRDLDSPNFNVKLQAFLRRTEQEREESIYVDWNAKASKWIKPQECPQSFGSTKILLDLAEHILFHAKIDLGP